MSNSGLYGSTGNVTVSSNNVTTLYNSNPSQVVTGNVSDRNFTTLYTVQAEIAPTKSYGNANVEAFLNQGTDGANTVQNIQMTGNLTVGNQSNLGNVSNVHITGGYVNQILTTDGGGHLTWANVPDLKGNVVPYVHFDVSTTGNNQSFTDANLSSYPSNIEMNVMKNGINLEPSQYNISGDVLTINIGLTTGDTVDVLASSAGSNIQPAGNTYEVQFNGGVTLASSNTFFFNPSGNIVNTQNIVISGNANVFGNINSSGNIVSTGNSYLGSNANVHITGGSNGSVLITNGSGNLSWLPETSLEAGSLNASIGNVIITGGTSGQFLETDGAGNLSWANVYSAPASAVNANVGNVHITGGTSGQVLATNGSAILYWTSNVPNANIANTVLNNSQPNITSLGTLTNLSVTGNINMQLGFELFTPNSTPVTGTINFDVVTQSIFYATANASSNITLNIRGNSSASLNSILPVNNSVTVVFLSTVGSTPYIVNQLQIDGTNVTPKWAGAATPTTGIRLANAQQSYTYTIMKTATNTYNVVASLTEYQ